MDRRGEPHVFAVPTSPEDIGHVIPKEVLLNCFPRMDWKWFVNYTPQSQSLVIENFIEKTMANIITVGVVIDGRETFDHGLNNHMKMGLVKKGISVGVKKQLLRKGQICLS